MDRGSWPERQADRVTYSELCKTFGWASTDDFDAARAFGFPISLGRTVGRLARRRLHLFAPSDRDLAR